MAGSWRGLFLFSFFVVSVLAVGEHPRPAVGRALTPLSFPYNDGEFSGTITIDRVQHTCPSGPCLLLKKGERILKPGNLQDFQKWLDATGVRVVEGDGNPWCTNPEGRPWRSGERGNPRFNCHSFAVGDYAGLTPNDWLEGVSSPGTENTNPMEAFLQSYFTPVKTYDIAKTRPADVETDEALKEGDLLVLTGRQDGKVFHVHSGRLVKREGKWQMMAKLGEDFPVVVGPIEPVCGIYARQFNEVGIYRVKPR